MKEIFDNANLCKVEDELVRIFTRYAPIDEPYGICTFNEEGKNIISRLFDIRKGLLDEMFVMNEEYKLLLNNFNEALKAELIDMRLKVIESYNTIASMHPNDYVRVDAKCYMACDYPKLHPVQTQRAKQMWKILSGVCGYYDPKYKDGVLGFEYRYDAKEKENDSENHLLYMKKEPYNWNEGLDEKLTQGMNLLYAFYNLYHHCKTFSLFDLLWVRNFKTDITIFIDSHSADVMTFLGSTTSLHDPELKI